MIKGEKYRYIGHCSRCSAHYSEVRVRPEGTPDDVYCLVAEDGSDLTSTYCCGRYVRMKAVKYRKPKKGNKPRTCNAKCMASKSLACSCECGGINHGAAHRH